MDVYIDFLFFCRCCCTKGIVSVCLFVRSSTSNRETTLIVSCSWLKVDMSLFSVHTWLTFLTMRNDSFQTNISYISVFATTTVEIWSQQAIDFNNKNPLLASKFWLHLNSNRHSDDCHKWWYCHLHSFHNGAIQTELLPCSATSYCTFALWFHIYTCLNVMYSCS